MRKFLIALVVTLLVVGCGGDNGPTEPPPTPDKIHFDISCTGLGEWGEAVLDPLPSFLAQIEGRESQYCQAFEELMADEGYTCNMSIHRNDSHITEAKTWSSRQVIPGVGTLYGEFGVLPSLSAALTQALAAQ